ncbi:unnamed protein product [Schistosoma turkestanicum]|nr:unnamed protein product [Schistosoma turkestanicum]
MNETNESMILKQHKLHFIRFRKSIHAKIAKTSALCYTWISLGLYSEVLGPTLPTLMFNTNCDYEQIGMALSTRAIGLLFGSLIGGILSDRFKTWRAAFIMLSLTVGAITTLIIPWCRNIIILTMILFIAGLSHGFLTTNGNPLLASIWQEKAAGPFSLMHSGYGLGAAISPLLVKPFTIPNNNSSTNHSIQTNLDNSQSNNDNPPQLQHHQNQINSTHLALINAVIPYSIIATIVLFCVFYFLIIIFIDHLTNSTFNNMILFKCNNHHHDNKDIDNDNNMNKEITSDNSKLPNKSKLSFKSKLSLNFIKHSLQKFYREKLKTLKKINVLIICCIFITFFTIVGNERVFGKFLFIYTLYGPIQFNLFDSYLINLIYWISFCVARIFTFFISLCISENIILLSLTIGTLLSSVGMISLPYEKVWFFLCTTLFGLFKSPLFPATLACINQSNEITGFLIIIVNFGSSLGATLLQFTAGRLIQLYGHVIFPYLVCGTSCLLLITSIILVIGLKHIGNRFKRDKNQQIMKIDTSSCCVDDDEDDDGDDHHQASSISQNDQMHRHSVITTLPRSKINIQSV